MQCTAAIATSAAISNTAAGSKLPYVSQRTTMHILGRNSDDISGRANDGAMVRTVRDGLGLSLKLSLCTKELS